MTAMTQACSQFTEKTWSMNAHWFAAEPNQTETRNMSLSLCLSSGEISKQEYHIFQTV